MESHLSTTSTRYAYMGRAEKKITISVMKFIIYLVFFSINVYGNLLQIAICFVKITLVNFSRQQFSVSVIMSLITASVNRDVVCTCGSERRTHRTPVSQTVCTVKSSLLQTLCWISFWDMVQLLVQSIRVDQMYWYTWRLSLLRAPTPTWYDVEQANFANRSI